MARNLYWQYFFLNDLEGEISNNKKYTVKYNEIHIIGKPKYKNYYRPPKDYKTTMQKAFHENALKRKRFFSIDGYEMIKPNKKILGSIHQYLYNNIHEKFPEHFGNSNVINWFDVQTTMIFPPNSLKIKWILSMLPYAEKFAKQKLEPTNAYGIRSYYNKSILFMHVDKMETHAIGISLNLMQEQMKEPWILEMFDNYGKKHEIDLQPNHAIVYESLTVHGRPKEMNGLSYTNMFFHFRPKNLGGSFWYEVEEYPKDFDISKLKYASKEEL